MGCHFCIHVSFCLFKKVLFTKLNSLFFLSFQGPIAWKESSKAGRQMSGAELKRRERERLLITPLSLDDWQLTSRPRALPSVVAEGALQRNSNKSFSKKREGRLFFCGASSLWMNRRRKKTWRVREKEEEGTKFCNFASTFLLFEPQNWRDFLQNSHLVFKSCVCVLSLFSISQASSACLITTPENLTRNLTKTKTFTSTNSFTVGHSLLELTLSWNTTFMRILLWNFQFLWGL